MPNIRKKRRTAQMIHYISDSGLVGAYDEFVKGFAGPLSWKPEL